jgi:Nickel responsive protein SCO4226-like
MPLYMDLHSRDVVTFEDVGNAHQADLQTQGSYDVSFLRYWVDGKHGKIFCRVQAPTTTPRRRYSAERTVSSLTRSTKCRRGHENAPQDRCNERCCRCPVCNPSGDCVCLRPARPRSVRHWSGSLSHGQVPQPHRCQKGRLLDLRRYGRNHLHRRTPKWVPSACTM